FGVLLWGGNVNEDDPEVPVHEPGRDGERGGRGRALGGGVYGEGNIDLVLSRTLLGDNNLAETIPTGPVTQEAVNEVYAGLSLVLPSIPTYDTGFPSTFTTLMVSPGTLAHGTSDLFDPFYNPLLGGGVSYPELDAIYKTTVKRDDLWVEAGAE